MSFRNLDCMIHVMMGVYQALPRGPTEPSSEVAYMSSNHMSTAWICVGFQFRHTLNSKTQMFLESTFMNSQAGHFYTMEVRTPQAQAVLVLGAVLVAS